jgi:hypothetical protein
LYRYNVSIITGEVAQRPTLLQLLTGVVRSSVQPEEGEPPAVMSGDARAVVKEFYMSDQANMDHALREKGMGCLGGDLDVAMFDEAEFSAAVSDGNLE